MYGPRVDFVRQKHLKTRKLAPKKDIQNTKYYLLINLRQKWAPKLLR